jgi:transposase
VCPRIGRPPYTCPCPCPKSARETFPCRHGFAPWRGKMIRLQLDDRRWSKVAAILRAERGAGRPGKDDRNFVEAVLWWRRTGVPWRDLPDHFGPWKTVFNRFDRWSKTGKWTRLFEAVRMDPDDEWHSLDSTINRVHQHAAGGKGGRPRRASGVHAGAPPRRSICSSMPSDFR